MESPNFSNAEFINQLIWNTGVTQLVSGIHAFAGNSVFFKPGLLFASSASYVLPGNLTIQVHLPSPFQVLFGSGAFCGAHGTANGQDTTSYIVDFSSFVPGGGSQTVYLGITYGTVQQDPYVVIGPPVGHPDYSTEFVPYVAYASLEETLILTPTTTVPDNKTVIELGRVTLSAGQTAITSFNTSFQQEASLLINALALSGDVTGQFSSNIISRLQGTPVSASSPTPNTFLFFNGTQWVPAAIGTLSGDVIGALTNNSVVKIRTIPVTATSPTDGQSLTYVAANLDLEWKTPSNTIAGDVTGTLPATTVVKLKNIPLTSTTPTDGQVLTFSAASNLLKWALPISGNISSGFVKIPVGTQVLVFQWGTFTDGNPYHNTDVITIPWNILFKTVCFGALTNVVNHFATVNLITAGILDPSSLTTANGKFLILAQPAGGNIVGVNWFAWGDGVLP